MSNRTNRADLEIRLKHLCNALGVNYGPECNHAKDSLNLDHYNPGGKSETYRIERNRERGGVSLPFGSDRHSANDLWVMMGFAIDALSMASLLQDA